MRIGAHVSISGQIDRAIDRALALGCECLQIFWGSPRQWRPAAYPEDALDRFAAKRRAAGLDPLVVHAAYLVNPAAADRALWRRSIASLLASARGAERLGGLAVVTHLGSAGGGRGLALRRVAAAVGEVLDATQRVCVLLENSAGGGGQLGASLDELAAVLDRLGGHPRVGVCLDTAHLFAAGWDLRTAAGVDATVAACDRAFGWARVRFMHLNDSKAPLGSHRDRHENIGEGEIGIEGFRVLLRHPGMRHLAGVIETPGFDRTGPDRRNLQRLKRLRAPGRHRARPTSARTGGTA
ncbi:MAG: deoxyribonuclease IV [Armatimonadota bacterium]|nr:deoxyribonuclease IV [Armatimonadota bacterium]